MSDILFENEYFRIYNHGSGKSLYYVCPGCKHAHSVPYCEGTKVESKWLFNGNSESPTIQPSVKHTAPPSNYCCHYFITNGMFHFCGDCSHGLSNQVVAPLPLKVLEDENHSF